MNVIVFLKAMDVDNKKLQDFEVGFYYSWWSSGQLNSSQEFVIVNMTAATKVDFKVLLEDALKISIEANPLSKGNTVDAIITANLPSS